LGTFSISAERGEFRGPFNIPPGIKGRPVVDVLNAALDELENLGLAGDEIDGWHDRRTHWGRREAHVATPLWDGWATLEIVGAFNRNDNDLPLRELIVQSLKAARALRTVDIAQPIHRGSNHAVIGAKVRVGDGRVTIKFSRPRVDTLAAMQDLALDGVPECDEAPPESKGFSVSHVAEDSAISSMTAALGRPLRAEEKARAACIGQVVLNRALHGDDGSLASNWPLD
jgi:hypothetical protein